MDPKDDAAATGIKPWRIEQSRYPLRDRWLTVRADDCVTAEGAKVAPFYVLEYSDWVQVVALDAEGNILLIKQYRHGLQAISLELPGGAVDAADSDPIQAGMRELSEETGFSARQWTYIGSLSPNPATHTNLCHIVLAQDIEQVSQPNDDPSERIESLRMPISEAIKLTLEGGIIQALHVASLTLALHKAGKWLPPAA